MAVANANVVLLLLILMLEKIIYDHNYISLNRMTKLAQTRINNDENGHVSKFLKLKKQNGIANMNNGEGKTNEAAKGKRKRKRGELVLEFGQAHQSAHVLKDAVIEMKEEETAQRDRLEFILQQNAKITMKHINAYKILGYKMQYKDLFKHKIIITLGKRVQLYEIGINNIKCKSTITIQ